MNSWVNNPAVRRIVLEAVILFVLASSVGLVLNFKLIFNAFSGQAFSDASVVDTMSKVLTQKTDLFPFPVALDELDGFISEGALLIDSRSEADYRLGHLPGALSLPIADLESGLANFKQQVPFERILITYCSGYGCPDSFDLGARLLKEGYQEVMVYEGGYPEWRDAGRPVEKSQQ
ncbi:MAG: rhodanese-like domain-containing protein [Desulfuromonadales bacterium]|nr:rhodanese-like domain-containing protein [Desulfuromonadales bacterium]MBN2791347.1 rhodanese-like domain-containing protein [Desulfuromonadales bacterium]